MPDDVKRPEPDEHATEVDEDHGLAEFRKLWDAYQLEQARKAITRADGALGGFRGHEKSPHGAG